ncbi:MAG: hypothetical protein Q8P84_06125 [Deltaproteobacteria bacterium]|nr:hypothetical protein [Deltaproteobacteria bacterium]
MSSFLNPMAVGSVLAQIESAYTQLGMPQAGSEMAWRAVLPSVAIDYGVEYKAESDLLTPNATPELHRLVNDFKNLTRGKRAAFQEEAIGAIHAEWQRAGGRFLLFSDATLDVYLSAMRNGEQLVEGGMEMYGDYGGLDPSILNKGLGTFSGGRGQIQLLSALAVVTGKHNWNLQRLPQFLKTAGGKPKELGWKYLLIDWRRGYIILQDQTAFQNGLEGYKLFAEKYADGDMKKAYQIASALLDKAQFKALGWGKQIHLKVSEVDRITKILLDGLKEGSLKERKGYRKFATDHADGDMLKAYKLASALLDSAQFKALGWGKGIHLKVSEVDRIINILLNGLKDGSLIGRKGYRKFATDHADGDMLKAHLLASALLDKAQFKALGWGKQIHLKVSEVDVEKNRLLQGLADESYVATDGWLKYFKTSKVSPQSSWSNASALLEERFAELGWPSEREAVKMVSKKAA